MVLLINRNVGTGPQLYPVCGKSGKLYGQATTRPEKGGPCFEMTLEDYERDKFDIIGNDRFHQQWIPEFISFRPRDLPPPKFSKIEESQSVEDEALTKGGPQKIEKSHSVTVGAEALTKSPNECSATTHMYRLRTLIEKAKKAKVFKKGMTESELKVALSD